MDRREISLSLALEGRQVEVLVWSGDLHWTESDGLDSTLLPLRIFVSSLLFFPW